MVVRAFWMRRAILHALYIPETVESPKEAPIEYDEPEDAGDEYNHDMPRRGPQIKPDDYGAETDPSIAQQSKRHPEEHRYLFLYLHLLTPNVTAHLRLTRRGATVMVKPIVSLFFLSFCKSYSIKYVSICVRGEIKYRLRSFWVFPKFIDGKWPTRCPCIG